LWCVAQVAPVVRRSEGRIQIILRTALDYGMIQEESLSANHHITHLVNMSTNTVTPSRKSNSPSTTPANSPLILSLPETPSSGSNSSTNPAKEAFFLLDLLQVVKDVSTALGQFKCNHGKDVADAGIKHLEVMMEALDWIQLAGTKQVGRISKVKYLSRAYELTRTAEKKRKADDPMTMVRRRAVCGLREFVRSCKRARSDEVKKEKAPPQPMPFYEEPRRSPRGPSPVPSTALLITDFTGLPPQGANVWTKETLAWFVDNLFTSDQKARPFLLKIIAKGMSPYKDHNSILKMYRKWKNNGKGGFRSVGRPGAMPVKEVEKGTNQMLKDGLHDSNTFKLKHMKNLMVVKKKEIAASNGLDPDSVNCNVTTQWAKVNMIATAARSNLAFSTKKLLTKTASRYRSEHSVMCGLSYTLTALTTMYRSGQKPSWLSGVDVDKLPASVKDTLEMVKSA
jgi:hypothetical protein